MIRSKRSSPANVDKLCLLLGTIFICSLASLSKVEASHIHQLIPYDIGLQQDPVLLWVRILSNAIMGFACFALFFAVRHFIQHKKDLSHPLVFWLLCILLLAFGLLHITKIWDLFQPLYWIRASVEVCTAAIAILATIVLWPLVPKTLTLKGAGEFEKVNKKLRESENQMQLIISGIQDYAIFALDLQGNVMSWNEGAEHINGYTAEEIIGRNVSCFFRPEDREKGLPAHELQMAIENGRYKEEGLRVRQDGSQFWANVILTAIYDQSGQLSGFAKVTRDITERKLAMNMLQEQADLLELSSDAVIVRDFDDTIRYWNHGAEVIYGYSKQQALGARSHNLLRTEHPKSSPAMEEDIFNKGRWEGELIHYRQNNQKIVVYSRHILKRDMHGNQTGILELNTDITERKEAEQQHLALAKMEQANAELEQFASIASHDLQEPLRAVAGCLQILEKTYKGRLDNNADELIQLAVEGAQQMRTLINDLLTLSRVGSEEMNFTVSDLSQTINHAKHNLATAIQESNATITYNNLPSISANSTLLLQLFQNLIGNAIKFRSNRPLEINIVSQRKEGQWLFSISDNGIGFEQKYSNRLFQPFKRLHTRNKYPGTGIGLAICKRIVERHGGRIWVESQLDKGTTFYFTIAERGDK